MKRVFNYSLAFAAAAMMFTACSSDEPNNNDGPQPGESAYLNVSIRDANDLTRAGEDATSPEFTNGTGNEGKVKDAHFYFFNANGIYAGQATIWDGGTPGTEGDNIELKGNSVVVLDNLKGNTYPKYMITLLNAGSQFSNDFFTPANLEGKNIKEFSEYLTNWGTNTDGGFLMATTSYFQGDDSDKLHNDAYYYATQLDQSNFARTAEAAKNTVPVTVYVERLAARVELTSNTYFPVDVTVMGADGDNPETGTDTGIAGTKLTVRIDGWYLNGVQQESHLSKQLGTWSAATTFAAGTDATDLWTWNIPLFHRSYWGQSVGYGNQVEGVDDASTGLKYFVWNTANAVTAGAGNYAYCNENTTTVANLSKDNNNLPNQRLMTSVVVKATVGTSTDGTGTGFAPIYLVEHNGVYFTKDRFIKYVLDIVNRQGKLNYYTRTGTEDKYDYTQVNATMFEIGGSNEVVFVQKAPGFPTKDLYAKNSEGKFDPVTETTLNDDLKAVTSGIRTRAFNDGKMYYNIPIKHMNTVKYDANGDLQNWYEGSFGVVRNHAYKLNINSVKRLGQGVFNPDTETIKPDPDPKDPNWFLGAQINVLAWKIVSSNVDL